MILYFISAQNIDHGHVFLGKISFARPLAIFNAIYSIGDFGAKPTSRVKHTEFSNDYLPSHAYSRKTNPVTMDFRVIYLSVRNFSITYQFFKKILPWICFKYIEKINKKGAFYVDVNVFSLSNLATLKVDISKKSSERYRFLFIFVCRTSKYTHMQKIKKKFYRDVNYVHLALIIC